MKKPKNWWYIWSKSLGEKASSCNKTSDKVKVNREEFFNTLNAWGKDPNKKFGLCVVPVYSQVGIATERALQNIVDTVFEKGELLDSVVRR